MKLRTFFMAALGLLLLSACSVTETLMQPSLPDEQGDLGRLEGDVSVSTENEALDGGITVVVHVDDQGFKLARSAELRILLTSKLIGDLNKVGVDDVNRKAEKNLFEELKLNILKGGSYDGPAVANYAVLATFLEASFGASYDKPLKIPFSDEAEYRKKPGTCDYQVTVHIGLKILDLYASAHKVKSINVKETEKGSFKTTKQNCPVSPTEKRALAQSATKAAAACLTVPLQQFLSPRGRITSSRQDEKGRTFFRISTGKSGGIKPGNAVKIYSQSTPDEQHLLAEGRVHKEIGADYAWVIVSDEAKAAEIKKGNLAKVSYESAIAGPIDQMKCRSIRTES